jgi:release factor glutamine methyltransferase
LCSWPREALSTRYVGVDISKEALRVAEINIQSPGLSGRAVLQQGDFYDLTLLGSGQALFDVILCNPPYLTEGECEKDGLLGPRVALVAAHKGLACYQMVARQVASFLKPNGVVVLEVGGKRNVADIRAIFQALDHVETRLDDQGRERCLVLRKYNPVALAESKVPPQD